MKPVKHFVAAILACLTVLGADSASRAGVRDIYPDPGQASADLAAALRVAAVGHRRIIVDFGGNWCPDCHLLDVYFHDADNKPLLDSRFVLVYVNIGQRDRNLELAERYRIPLKKGVPALAVLDSDGTLLFSQATGEFENMRGMHEGDVTAFLTRWAGAAR